MQIVDKELRRKATVMLMIALVGLGISIFTIVAGKVVFYAIFITIIFGCYSTYLFWQIYSMRGKRKD